MINLIDTQYPIIKEICKNEFNWRISMDYDEEWDVLWTDNAITPDMLSKMKPF